MNIFDKVLNILRDEEITKGDMYANINESTMSRIWDKLQEEQLDFAILTAYRKENDKKLMYFLIEN